MYDGSVNRKTEGGFIDSEYGNNERKTNSKVDRINEGDVFRINKRKLLV